MELSPKKKMEKKWRCVRSIQFFLISCIQDLLKDKLVVLATHQVHFAMLANKLLVLKDVGSYCICNIIWWSKIMTVAFTLAVFSLV